MGINIHRGRIVCDKRWPDGSRFTRVCTNRTQAKQLLARIDVAIADGTWRELRERLKLRERQKVTLREYSTTYIEEYGKPRNKERAWKRKVTSFNALNAYLGDVELEAISPGLLHHYVQHRKKQRVSNTTINRDITILKHLLTYASDCGVIKANPVEKFKNLREERRERPRFTDAEVQAVIDAARVDCRSLFVFIRETGCRREEAFALQHWQIQADANLVVFSGNMKSGKYRYVPLTETAAEAVKALPKLEGCEYVFYNPKTRTRWFDCRKPWIQARESAGLPEMQIKDLRRHYAIKLAESGADMHDIQQVLGHASVATTERHYAQFSPRHSAKKILRVLEGGRSRTDTRRIQGDLGSDSIENGSRASAAESTG